jgi:hypothetical protein
MMKPVDWESLRIKKKDKADQRTYFTWGSNTKL